ncbi:MAG: hypothetical protein M3434_04735, partial [Gemmatimonadota bacterium]|nr:hypothetical protein [Gemmatimonadota bacterium]
MIAFWMLYALLVSGLIGVAALVTEQVCRLIGSPVRWAWLGALLAVLGLVALAPLRMAPPEVTLPAPSLAIPETSHAANGSQPLRWPSLMAALGTARATVAQPLRAAAALGEGDTGRALAAGWIVLSLALLGIAAATLLRSRGARRSWPLREVAGTPVRVAPTVGPAVLGLHRPEVVVPEWLLQAPPEEQRLVVMHEQEHIRARDPLLLAVGCLV